VAGLGVSIGVGLWLPPVAWSTCSGKQPDLSSANKSSKQCCTTNPMCQCICAPVGALGGQLQHYVGCVALHASLSKGMMHAIMNSCSPRPPVGTPTCQLCPSSSSMYSSSKLNTRTSPFPCSAPEAGKAAPQTSRAGEGQPCRRAGRHTGKTSSCEHHRCNRI
jgi:hypothetical protein